MSQTRAHGSHFDVADLVRSAAGGDASAWNRLVDEYVGWLWAVARSYRLSQADAADAIQTTWLRLLEHIDRLHDPERVGAWLTTTMRRECLRTLAYGKRVAAAEESALERADGAADASDQLIVQEETRALRAAIDTLPPRWRELMLLLTMDPSPSYAEIAARLQIPIGSIGPTRGRCLQRLRANMA